MSGVNKPSGRGLIRFITGPLMGMEFPITQSVTTIGRDSRNDIVIRDDRKVSRLHARLLWNQGSWIIEKLPNASIVLVDAKEVKQQAILLDHSSVVLGEDTSFLFQVISDQEEPALLDEGKTFFQTAQKPPAYPPAATPAVEIPPAVAAHPPAAAAPAYAHQQAGYTPVAAPPAFAPPPAAAPVAAAPSAYAPPPAAPAAAAPSAYAPPPATSGYITVVMPPDQVPAATAAYPPPSSVRRFTGLIARPDATQVAPPSRIGIPTMEVSSNNSTERQVFVLDKESVSIGREHTNDIVIYDQTVSSFHCQIVRQGNELILIHPHPTQKQTLNGLFYQGRKVRGDEPFRHSLNQGDLFRIGDENGAFVTLAYRDGSEAPQELLPPVTPIKLSNTPVSIGRASDNTLVLAHPQVSSHHARLVPEGGSHRILDLGSTNHVYVNGQLASDALLKLGDEIRIGPYKLVYESTHLTQYDESNFIRIDALNLRQFGGKHTVLLDNVSLSIPPRKFVALVGGSGAGKTTLLKALSGLRLANEGTVLYNGQDYYRNLESFKTQIGYVPQDDIVHTSLTVERALYFAAKMRLPRDFTKRQISQRIDEVLEDVEMQDRRKLLIKSLSGGQRKRVSIALELLANPGLFFLDEPTSGLDPSLDRKMMFLLRKLADKGHTIVLVTHATNNLSACDYVCFLARGGRVAYYGPPEGAKTYFAKDDFAEIYSLLEPTEENPNAPEEAQVRFRSSPDYQTYIAQPLKGRPTEGLTSTAKGKRKSKRPKHRNGFAQFLLLARRDVAILRGNRRKMMTMFMQAPMAALLLMLLTRSGIGSNIFDANTIVQCRTQVRISSGTLSLPGATNPVELVSCDQVVTFLEDDPQGIQYAQQNGGVNAALQNFIAPSRPGGDAQRIIFLICFFVFIFNLINGTTEIAKERAIYERERAVNLRILPYMFSKFFGIGHFALLQAVLMVLITQLFEPLGQGIFADPFTELDITVSLAALAGMMLGLFFSTLGSEETVASLLPLGIIPQVMFSGFIIPLKNGVLQAISVVVPVRWALVAAGSTLGLHSDKIDGSTLFDDDPIYHGTLYSIYSQSDALDRLLLAWGMLGLLIVVLAILIGLSLKRKDKRR